MEAAPPQAPKAEATVVEEVRRRQEGRRAAERSQEPWEAAGQAHAAARWQEEQAARSRGARREALAAKAWAALWEARPEVQVAVQQPEVQGVGQPPPGRSSCSCGTGCAPMR